MKKNCGFFTNIAPFYSRPLWVKLSSSSIVEYVFYSSRKGYSGIKTIDISESKSIENDAHFNWLFLKNIYIRNILFYQIGAAFKCITTDYSAYIFNAEAQCISNWLGAVICRLRRKPVLFWGHGLHGDEKWIKKTIQLSFYRLADYHLIYSNRSRLLMIESGFNPEKLFTVYNSLDFETHFEFYSTRNLYDLEKFKKSLFPASPKYPVVIFIGRLTKEKKVDYLLKAIDFCKRKNILINCLIVGAGRESDSLKKLSLSLGLEKLVCFFGSSYDEKINAQMIMMADCCVSPGNVGLTAIHSMSLGTPVITHGNMSNQGPEAEAIIEKKTGLFFEENNISSLSDTIENLIFNLKKSSMEANCLEQIKEFWNPVNQSSIFDIAVRKAMAEKF
jgi:glycosyltransferase involved in cell wall biosynthesis